MWGGDLEAIIATIDHGVRNETDGDARWSEMPAFGEILSDEEIDSVVAFVGSLSVPAEDATLAAAGATVFADNCSACHGDEGKGDRDSGAPNLADAIWLYGDDKETVTETVRNSRFGVMPAWGQRLSDEDVSAVAIYVHNLGGGE